MWSAPAVTTSRGVDPGEVDPFAAQPQCPLTSRFSLYIQVTHWRNAGDGNGGLSPTHFDIGW